jgi:hypothetical protein
MRILLSIPHYFGPHDDGLARGSARDSAARRAAALSRCLTSLRGHLGGRQSLAHLNRPEVTPANDSQDVQIDIIVCTLIDRHLLSELAVDPADYILSWGA